MKFSIDLEKIPFMKMTGSGNDFIIIDNRKLLIKPEEMAEFARRACRRKVSTGADGLIFIEEDPEVDFSWRFFNADGSEAEMCGNGARCASRFVWLKNIVKKPSMVFRTKAGFVKAEVREDSRFVKVQIPSVHSLKTNIELPLEGSFYNVHFVNIGVPHVVLMLSTRELLEKQDVVGIGRSIRYHEYFMPAGTNVNFAYVQDEHNLFIRTYERGVEDETLACGTGSIASALIASKLNKASSPVSVHTRGGEVIRVFFDVSSDGSISNVFLEGQALVVYEGFMWKETLENEKE